MTMMLMGVPAWRHLDLLPILARRLPEDEDDSDWMLPEEVPHGEFDTSIFSGPPTEPMRASTAGLATTAEVDGIRFEDTAPMRKRS